MWWHKRKPLGSYERMADDLQVATATGKYASVLQSQQAFYAVEREAYTAQLDATDRHIAEDADAWWLMLPLLEAWQKEHHCTLPPDSPTWRQLWQQARAEAQA